jgi:phage antirepressor YoqD-like protein
MENQLSKESMMTIKEIAEIFRVDERTIRRAIEKHFPDILKNGIKTYLSELQITTIKKELEGHHNLGSIAEVKNIQTDLEINNKIIEGYELLLQQTAKLQKAIEIQKIEIEQKSQLLLEQEPKVVAWNNFLNSQGTFSIGEIAAFLVSSGHKWCGENRLFAFLREVGVLQKANWNQPFIEQINNGNFIYAPKSFTKNNGESNTYGQARATTKGAEYILKLVLKREAESKNKNIELTCEVAPEMSEYDKQLIGD